mmetsp:Transcript_45932/g.131115  ORF Transcript_45932/g.131115 Transcript_45932/m.131115 type:complete len:245 (+) Transcript_45932:70-804(+)
MYALQDQEDSALLRINASPIERNNAGVPHVPQHPKLVAERRPAARVQGLRRLDGHAAALVAAAENDAEAALAENLVGVDLDLLGLDEPPLPLADCRDGVELGGQERAAGLRRRGPGAAGRVRRRLLRCLRLGLFTACEQEFGLHPEAFLRDNGGEHLTLVEFQRALANGSHVRERGERDEIPYGPAALGAPKEKSCCRIDGNAGNPNGEEDVPPDGKHEVRDGHSHVKVQQKRCVAEPYRAPDR